jgi:hypothetical protein
MHRSGTSAFTRVLSLLGCDLPKTLLGAHNSNKAGHWESKPVCLLNDRILESAGSNWHDWLEVNPGWLQSPKAEEFREEALALLHEEFGSSRLFVLKDPRICRLIPFWLEVLEGAGARPLIVSPVRSPLEVAASLGERNGFQAALAHLLWLRHVLEGEFASRGIPRYFASYNRLMGGWTRAAMEAQMALGIAWPRMSDKVAREIDGFLSEEFRHHQRPAEAILENPTLSDWLRSTFEILNRWADAGEDPRDFARLDRIKAEMNTAAPAFSCLFDTLQEKAARLEKELGSERHRLGEAEQQISRLDSELESRTHAAEEAEKVSARLKEHIVLLMADVRRSAKRLLRLSSRPVQRSRRRRTRRSRRWQNRSGRCWRCWTRPVTRWPPDFSKPSRRVPGSPRSSKPDCNSKPTRSRRSGVWCRKSKARPATSERKPSGSGIWPPARLTARLPGFSMATAHQSHWRPFRLRRQITLLRRSGLFDAEWYLRQNTDVASAGMDPLRHYVEFGAKEGRAPNAALAHANGKAEVRVETVSGPDAPRGSQSEEPEVSDALKVNA